MTQLARKEASEYTPSELKTLGDPGAVGMSDINATKLGLKTYVNGVTYNGSAPSTTSAQGGFIVRFGEYVPYQMQDGAWRLKFNLSVDITAASISAGSTFDATLPFTVKNLGGTNDRHGIAGHGGINASPFWTPIGASIGANSGSLSIRAVTTYTFTGFVLLGDVPLASKPTWAY
jgi:hypothetical protein